MRCKDGAYCEDPSCDYLHDNQWNLKASPMWLIEGVKTVSATREGKFSWTPLSPIAPCPSEDSAIEVEDEAPRPRDPQASALEG